MKAPPLLSPAEAVALIEMVVTLPSELRGLARSDPKAVYGLLMRSANETLLDLARNPKWMGEVPGITSVLHTWPRDLRQHPHMHSVVAGGGLTLDGTRQPGTRPLPVPGEGHRLCFPRYDARRARHLAKRGQNLTTIRRRSPR